MRYKQFHLCIYSLNVHLLKDSNRAPMERVARVMSHLVPFLAPRCDSLEEHDILPGHVNDMNTEGYVQKMNNAYRCWGYWVKLTPMLPTTTWGLPT